VYLIKSSNNGFLDGILSEATTEILSSLIS
jgi:hypothetical protein